MGNTENHTTLSRREVGGVAVVAGAAALAASAAIAEQKMGVFAKALEVLLNRARAQEKDEVPPKLADTKEPGPKGSDKTPARAEGDEAKKEEAEIPPELQMPVWKWEITFTYKDKPFCKISFRKNENGKGTLCFIKGGGEGTEVVLENIPFPETDSKANTKIVHSMANQIAAQLSDAFKDDPANVQRLIDNKKMARTTEALPEREVRVEEDRPLALEGIAWFRLISKEEKTLMVCYDGSRGVASKPLPEDPKEPQVIKLLAEACADSDKKSRKPATVEKWEEWLFRVPLGERKIYVKQHKEGTSVLIYSSKQ